MSKIILLDASAVLCLLHQEVGAEQVTRQVHRAAISAVNAAEVYSKLFEANAPNREIDRVFTELNLSIIAFEKTIARQAGILRPLTKSYGLSLGDRTCLATAICFGMSVMTADKAWKQLDLGVDIVCIR